MMGMGMGMGLGEPPADYGSIAAVGLFVALMCVCIVVGHLLEENRWMNESTTALLIVSPLLLPYPSSVFCCVCWCCFGLGARWFYCAEVAGAGHWHGHPAGVEREALAVTGVQ
jgi:hypothetical protein